MAFEDAFPIFAQGPRTDLTWAYLATVLNGTTVATDATRTSRGFSITRSTNGVYALVFPKCKYCQIVPVFMPTVAGNGLVPRVLSSISPTAGTATIELSATAAGAAADPAAAANVLELRILLGF